jgi:hypothetical protein
MPIRPFDLDKYFSTTLGTVVLQTKTNAGLSQHAHAITKILGA